MNILITGGAGNIGGSLAMRLREKHNVSIIDNLSTSSLTGLDLDRIDFHNANVNENQGYLQYVFDECKPDLVFHFAACVGVKRTQQYPFSVLGDINGTRNILHHSLRAKRVFYASSSEVYGPLVNEPQHEDKTPLNPTTTYAAVKLIGEHYFKAYNKQYGLPYTIFRFFNTYGPRQSNNFVIKKFIDLALQNKDIPIYGKGDQSRTFLYIDDALDTIEKIVSDDLCINDTINIGNRAEYTILDLARIIIEMTDSSSKIEFLDPLEAGDMMRRKPNINKMSKILMRPPTMLFDGINKMI